MFSFEKVYGNEKIIESLQNSIRKSKVSHAYILWGQAGLGKKLLANSFAKTLQCEKQGVTPCNECISCVTFESGNHPDIFWIRPTKTKSLGIDDIREQVTKRMETKPYKYNYKVFIIEKADLLTTSASNALLKTIEEPSGFGMFLLLGETNNFLPTIISRCVVFKLKPLAVSIVKKYLIENAVAADENAEMLAIYSQGNIGRALMLASDEEFTNMREETIDILNTLPGCDELDALMLVKRLEPFKERIQEVLDIAYFWYHDIIIARTLYSGGDCEKYYSQRDKTDIILSQADKYTLNELFKKTSAVWEAKLRLRRYTNFQLTMEILLLNLHGIRPER